MTRTRVVLGNWKQNLLRAEASALASRVAAVAKQSPSVSVGIAPTYVSLDVALPYGVPLYAQDVGGQESGAFTGEVGPAMLRDAGCTGVLVGHSERRALYGDTDETVCLKLRVSLGAGLRAVLCVGEPLEVRDQGGEEKFVISQLCAALVNLPPQLSSHLIVAYEPVWAIGTGRTASPAQAQTMHKAIRGWLAEHLPEGADRSLLYGGSVKPSNGSDLLGQPDIDGFLVGGASLDADAFAALIRIAEIP